MFKSRNNLWLTGQSSNVKTFLMLHFQYSVQKMNEKLFFGLPTEDSVASLKDSKVEIVFDVKREVI